MAGARQVFLGALVLLAAARSLMAVQLRPVNHAAQGAPVANVKTTSMFCWMVVGPWDSTAALARQQLEACGDYALFSNVSIPEEKTIKLWDHPLTTNMVTTHPGRHWGNLTYMFRDAWRYIQRSAWPDKYEWIVKIDADTFVRPRYLQQYLADFDASGPLGITIDGRFQGALEAVTSRALRHENTEALFKPYGQDIMELCEDVWLTHAMQWANFPLVDAVHKQGCVSYLLWWNLVPLKYRDPPNTYRGKNVLPSMIQNAGELAVLHTGKPVCVHREVAAIHPVKSLSIFQQYVHFDILLQSAEVGSK